MSHELEMREGRASFFEVGDQRDAWHKEGILLSGAPSFDEAMRIARLDYEVYKEQALINGLLPGNAPIPSKKAFVTRRSDNGTELGSVGPDYTVTQNVDAFASMIPLVDTGVVKLETGGVLREGADAWLLGKFNIEQFGPIVREVFADEVVPYALLTNNHSGRRKMTVALTPIRVVCANTLGMAEVHMDTNGKAISVAHRGDAGARMVEASQALFGGIIERYEVVAKQFRLLKNFYLDEAMFESLVLVPAIGVHPTARSEFNPDARLAENMVERYEKRVSTIRNLWTSGKGHTGDKSAWEAYNGVVEAIDHDEDLFPSRSGVYRLGSLIDGTLRKKKDAVLDKLVTVAAAQ